jgi:succinate dehydrogenase / fumarate reductase cytochrome b subunit
MPALLWGARAGLLVVAGLHLVTAIQLKRINSAARPEAYRSMSTVQATTSSRYMYFSGSMIAFYAIGHLLHFTLGVLMPENFHLVDAQGRHDVYQMVVRSFQNPLVAGLYVVAMVMLASHLSHGISSLFQTFGFVNKTVRNITNKLGPGLAYIIVVGYIAIPLSVVFGIVGGHP